jgi:hypothetical protein
VGNFGRVHRRGGCAVTAELVSDESRSSSEEEIEVSERRWAERSSHCEGRWRASYSGGLAF